MQKEDLVKLVTKITDGTANDQEIELYNSYYMSYQDELKDWDETVLGKEQEIRQKLKQSIKAKIKPVKIIPIWRRPISIAAMVLLCASVGLLIYKSKEVPKFEQLVKHDVAPGGNKAILTLANGQTINLSDAKNGSIATQSAISITKTADGKVIYKVASGENGEEPVSFNTITTPIGGQYQVELPDGTKVWLNAASSIKFPTSFAKMKDRRIELTGEGYFEVAHNKKQPFIVKTGSQELAVLGTHFDINSYADEGAIRTTLVEGSVIVRNTEKQSPIEGKDFVRLKPGEQASLTGAFKVTEADVEMVTAWKDGSFLFNELELHYILKQLARWYNVGVDYDNVPENRFFTGFISRDVNLSKVLEMLEVTGGIKFKIEGKTIKIINLKK